MQSYTIQINEEQRDIITAALNLLMKQTMRADNDDFNEILILQQSFDQMTVVEAESPGIIHCFHL
jgi:hypothetical protein